MAPQQLAKNRHGTAVKSHFREGWAHQSPHCCSGDCRDQHAKVQCYEILPPCQLSRTPLHSHRKDFLWDWPPPVYKATPLRNCLQWGRSNSVDPAKIWENSVTFSQWKIPKWGQTLFFKPCFSASTALSSFCRSTFVTLPLEGSMLWEIMQFSSQSESVESSAMDAGTPLKNGV